jgi:transposase
MDKKIIKKQGRYFTQEEQHAIIQEMISNGCSKKEIWKKYTGQEDEHGQLLRWMKKLGYAIVGRPISTKFEGKRKVMPVNKKAVMPNQGDDSFENLQFKKRIFELEKQLKDAELKAIAFSTMVDIAEREFNIPIRKKLNTKP